MGSHAPGKTCHKLKVLPVFKNVFSIQWVLTTNNNMWNSACYAKVHPKHANGLNKISLLCFYKASTSTAKCSLAGNTTQVLRTSTHY